MKERYVDKHELRQRNTIGARIILLRHEKGISREQLAQELGCSIKVMYNIESDITIPNIEQAVKMSKLFGTTIDYIVLGKR